MARAKVQFRRRPGAYGTGMYDVLVDGEVVGELWNSPGNNNTLPSWRSTEWNLDSKKYGRHKWEGFLKAKNAIRAMVV